MARSLIVRHAEGFVHKGQLNVTLGHQLYWLGWVFYNAIILIVFPLPPLLTTGNMRTTKSVRICMFTNLAEEEEENDKNQTTSLIANMVGGFIQLFYTTFFTRRVHNYKANNFPRGRMSAIGFYKRNVITFSTTAKFAFMFILSFNWLIKLSRIFLFKRVDHVYLFYIESACWFILIDMFYICLSLFIASHEMPSNSKRKISHFPKPINLEPRREFKGKEKASSKIVLVKPPDHYYDDTAGPSRFRYIQKPYRC